MWDRILTPPEQVPSELPVVLCPPPIPGPITWREKLVAWIPRISLLNLLFLTMLIALAAAFISQKISKEQQIAALERKIGRINYTNSADRRLFEGYSRMPHPASIGAIRLLPRTQLSKNYNQYNLLVILDPAKNYVVELNTSNSAQKEFIQVARKVYLRALSDNPEARSYLQLEVQFLGDNPLDNVNPTMPFDGRLDFYLRWHGWHVSEGRDISEGERLGQTPQIELYKNDRTYDFTNRFVHPAALAGAAELANFKWHDANQEIETYSIVIREIPERQLPKMSANRFLISVPANP